MRAARPCRHLGQDFGQGRVPCVGDIRWEVNVGRNIRGQKSGNLVGSKVRGHPVEQVGDFLNVSGHLYRTLKMQVLAIECPTVIVVTRDVGRTSIVGQRLAAITPAVTPRGVPIA